MASIYIKRGKLWARLKGDKVPGKWSGVPTGYKVGDEAAAERYAHEAQRRIDDRNGDHGRLTLRLFVASWLERRCEAGHDWRKDRGRLTNHVLPALGDLELADITTARVADLVHGLRFTKRLAARTVRNVYSVLAAVLRDAAIGGKISSSPCVLTEAQLGPVVDKDPEWRGGALFTRKEAEALISDRRIPLDRQVVYAFGLLAGMRPGEGAALRWRHYNADHEPLGCLTVATSYSTTYSRVKGTKTLAVRYVPVHPTLAALLEEWRASWAAMFGREPGPEDLIVPLPPDVKRTKRTGDRFRGWDYTGRRWREVDLPALGWRTRSVYDTKSTMITLAIDDGADPAVIRDRVTHTKSKRDAFSGYDRGPHWEAACRELGKLRLARATALRPVENPRRETWLRRRVSNAQSGPLELHVIQGGREVIPTACDLSRAMLVASVLPAQTNDSRQGRRRA